MSLVPPRQGIELVKENLVVNERLNAFVGSIGNIPPLRGAVQFPAVTVSLRGTRSGGRVWGRRVTRDGCWCGGAPK